MNLEEDAETFIEEARSVDFLSMSKRDVQSWLFRVKKDLSARYSTSIEGFETDYEAYLEHKEGNTVAEFVVDRRGDEAELNAFLVIDGEGVLNDVWTLD